eukprot:6174175-Pleurochrysis_carterae.AAC.1
MRECLGVHLNKEATRALSVGHEIKVPSHSSSTKLWVVCSQRRLLQVKRDRPSVRRPWLTFQLRLLLRCGLVCRLGLLALR